MKTNRIYGCRYVAAAFLFAFLLFFGPFGSVQAKKGDNAVPVVMQPTAKAIAKELKQEGDDLHLYDGNGNRMKNNAWVSYGGQLFFPNAEGKVYRHTILRFGDERAYYVNQKGALQNGLVFVGGDLRYFFESGEKMNEMAQDAGWVWSHRGWIFVNENAKVYHDQFITFGPQNKYYMGAKGVMQTGKVRAKGTVYDIAEDGRVKMGAHRYTADGKTYYAQENGEPYRSMFLTDPSSGDTYYFGPTGIMLKGISRIAGDYYYFTESGKDAGKLAKKVGWYTTSEGRVFAAPGGKLYHDQFITFGPQNKYYMGAKGVMQTGKVRAKGTVYDIAEDGRVKMGAHRYTADGKTYYAQENGEPYRSMFLTDPSSGDTYYFGPTGIMLKGISRIAGDYYYFTESGKDAGKLAKKVGWYTTSEGRVFAAPGGKLYHDRFITFGPKIRYYMGSDGTLQQGLVKANGTVYRMQGESGSLLQQASSYTHQGKWYFAAENGEPYRNRIISFGAKRYLMGADGSRQDGAVTVNGVAYRCDVAAGTVEKVHDYDFLWPVAGRTRISSGFGMRWGHMHKGIDIPAPTGTPVRAAHGGGVVAVGYHSSCGNYVQLVGDNGLFTNYFHLSKILAMPGQTVQEGEVIGLVGSTGNSTGAHLHFEVRTGGKWGQAHNPLNYSYTY